jgi:dipeptidase D
VKALISFEDEIRNVIIRTNGWDGKPKSNCASRTFGYGTSKNSDTVFDFDTQGIDMYVDGDWVRARGTRLVLITVLELLLLS